MDTCQTHQIQPGHERRCRVGVGVVSDTGHGKGLGCPCFIGYFASGYLSCNLMKISWFIEFVQPEFVKTQITD